ncbi:MAG: hypothetical protein ACU83N_04720 [Gammaproteobacteria bacterium]
MSNSLCDDKLLDDKDTSLGALKDAICNYIKNGSQNNKENLQYALTYHRRRSVQSHRSDSSTAMIAKQARKAIATFNIRPTNSYARHLKNIKHAKTLTAANKCDWDNVSGDLWSAYGQCLLNLEENKHERSGKE